MPLHRQHLPEDRDQVVAVAHRGIQANAPGREALEGPVSGFRPSLSDYKRHPLWDNELFFKWIRQHLRIKSFFGNSENAVKTQIWIAVSVYVLVAIIRKRLALDVSLYTILQVLSLTLFEKMPLYPLLGGGEHRIQREVQDNQLNLFMD